MKTGLLGANWDGSRIYRSSIWGGRVFFLPEDEPRSRIFVREIPR